MATKITTQGYANKVLAFLDKHPEKKCAVFTTGIGDLHFTHLHTVPELLGVYDKNVKESWLMADAEAIGLNEASR